MFKTQNREILRNPFAQKFPDQPVNLNRFHILAGDPDGGAAAVHHPFHRQMKRLVVAEGKRRSFCSQFVQNPAHALRAVEADIVVVVDDRDLPVSSVPQVFSGDPAGFMRVDVDAVKRIRMFVAEPDHREIPERLQDPDGFVFPCDADDPVEPAVFQIADPVFGDHRNTGPLAGKRKAKILRHRVHIPPHHGSVG